MDAGIITLWAVSLVLFLFLRLILRIDRRARASRANYESELPGAWV
jgi:hypothetical protein